MTQAFPTMCSCHQLPYYDLLQWPEHGGTTCPPMAPVLVSGHASTLCVNTTVLIASRAHDVVTLIFYPIMPHVLCFYFNPKCPNCPLPSQPPYNGAYFVTLTARPLSSIPLPGHYYHLRPQYHVNFLHHARRNGPHITQWNRASFFIVHAYNWGVAPSGKRAILSWCQDSRPSLILRRRYF